MDWNEAKALTVRIFGRYPASAGQVDKAVLAVWAEEFSDRFGLHPVEEIQELAVQYCRQNPSQWAPSLDQLCEWITRRLRARQDRRLRLVEPPPSNEEIARHKARLRELTATLMKPPGLAEKGR